MISKYWLALAAGAVGLVLLHRRQTKGLNGCGCLQGCGCQAAMGDIDALPQHQVFVDPQQRYVRSGTR